MSLPVLYLGTHLDDWIGRDGMPPLFISRNRLVRKRSRTDARPRRWPTPRCESVALDSGAFTELLRHGRWTVTPDEYADFIMQAADHFGDRLDFVAVQDWLCAPSMIERTGMDLDWHIKASVESVAELRGLLPEELRRYIFPVLQGWQPEDYMACAALYADVGIDLESERYMTIGSLVRGDDDSVIAVLSAVSEIGVPFHTFGVKGRALVEGYRQTSTYVPSGEPCFWRAVGLSSSDSTNWSYVARKRKIKLDRCTHQNCGNCCKWAINWWDSQYDSLVAVYETEKAG